MKVCSVCNEIVSAGQGCARSNCPNQAEANPAPKLQPGYTGKADRFVQAGLDGADSVAREATRRAAITVAVIFAITLVAGLLFLSEDSPKSEDEPATTMNSQRWFGVWQCETFGPHSNGNSVTIRIDATGWHLLGNEGNPFYGMIAKHGEVRELNPTGESSWKNLDLDGLNSNPPSGQWVSYNNNGYLGWISWGGEGSENPCQKIG